MEAEGAPDPDAVRAALRADALPGVWGGVPSAKHLAAVRIALLKGPIVEVACEMLEIISNHDDRGVLRLRRCGVCHQEPS